MTAQTPRPIRAAIHEAACRYRAQGLACSLCFDLGLGYPWTVPEPERQVATPAPASVAP